MNDGALGKRQTVWRNRYTAANGIKLGRCGNELCPNRLPFSAANLCARCQAAVDAFWREYEREVRR